MNAWKEDVGFWQTVGLDGGYNLLIGAADMGTGCDTILAQMVAELMECDVDDRYSVYTDGRRVQQVIINFLTNACKHTIAGEIVLKVSLTENPGMVTFSVTDTGTGVPPEKAEYIFKRFTQLDNFTQGNGLGLNICSIIAEKLEGKVMLDTTYTNGARFVFMIPDRKNPDGRSTNPFIG